jgi:3,4-dihydroxy 2-butanone 4-phosphate synthase / GTP cyclohydrolase II
MLAGGFVPAAPADRIDAAVRQLAGGATVLVVDDASEQITGVLVSAAQYATTSSIAFMVRHTSGLLCAAMPAERLDDLELPPMPTGRTNPGHSDRSQTQFHVAVDAAHGVSTGISAADRTRTVRVLADRSSTATDLVRPGHVFPVRADGLTERASPAGVAVALVTRAQLAPVGVIATVTNDDGELPSEADLQRFAAVHELESVHLRYLVEQHMRDNPVVRRGATTRLPTRHGEFLTHGYRDARSGAVHLAMVLSGVDPTAMEPVHVHHECLVGDALGSTVCGCGQRLDKILEQIARHGTACSSTCGRRP